MKKAVAVALLGVAFSSVSVLADDIGTAPPPIRHVRIAIDGGYPPFSMVTAEGELAGFDVDIARALCDAAELDCEIVTQDWDGMIPGLMARKFDAVVASMAITPERLEKVDFTHKYYTSPGKFVAPKDADLEITPEGLAGRTACVQVSTIHERYLRATFPDADVQTYRSQQEALFDLAAGRCDVLLGEGIMLEDAFLETPEGEGFAFVGPTVSDPKWYGEGAGIAVHKGDAELVRILNAAIDEIRANGTYARINDRYFDFDIYGE